MNLSAILAFAAVALSLGISLLALVRDFRSWVHRIFAAGMFTFALEAICLGMTSLEALSPVDIIFWQKSRIAALAFLPGIWLSFSMTFARAEFKKNLLKWKWLLSAAFIVPIVLSTFFQSAVFTHMSPLENGTGWAIYLGWSGYSFFLCLLIASVLILGHLERTLRASVGSVRWRIKFMILSVSCLFAVRIYTCSQTLLFSSLVTSLGALNTGALLLADIMIVVWFIRTRLGEMDVYVSTPFLYNSITILIAGVYLLVIGILSELISYFGQDYAIPLGAFFVLLACAALGGLLLSDDIRQRSKRFLYRHLRRPQYDYQREWRRFAQRTTRLLEPKEFCAEVSKMVCETFGISSAAVWLLDGEELEPVLCGSTFIPLNLQSQLRPAVPLIREIMQEMSYQRRAVDFLRTEVDWFAGFAKNHSAALSQARIRYCAPIRAAKEFLGIMTLNERVTGEDFSLEDLDLLQTIADQAGGHLLNLKLSERLRMAKQMEAFQTLSAFFVHDLKNLASTLSLMLQNFPIHFDNPEFRNDALQLMSQGVSKIENMCGRLTFLNEKIELQQRETDLNALIRDTLSDLRPAIRASLVEDLHQVPNINLDCEHIKKVLTNLILNANEAVNSSGVIRVGTSQENGYIVLFVCDNGCGMSQEFINRSLFHPFKTTKKRGLGIGLYHSKKIVEAHQGKIEVESREGKGSTFRILLPLGESRLTINE